MMENKKRKKGKKKKRKRKSNLLIVSNLKAVLKMNGIPKPFQVAACQCSRPRLDLWVRKIPWRRKRQLIPVFLPGEFHEQRSYSPLFWLQSMMSQRVSRNWARTRTAYQEDKVNLELKPLDVFFTCLLYLFEFGLTVICTIRQFWNLCSYTGINHECPTFCPESGSVSQSVMSDSFDRMDCSPPGSSLHGIPQARLPEWVAMSLSREPSWPQVLNLGSPASQADSLLSEPPGKPHVLF